MHAVIAQSAKELRKVIAMLCVAVMCVFCVQMTIITVDRIEHALEIDHHATDLAGAIQCTPSPDKCEPSTDPSHPVSHSHSSDTSASSLAALIGDAATVVFSSTVFSYANSRALAGLSQHAPERPPKA